MFRNLDAYGLASCIQIQGGIKTMRSEKFTLPNYTDVIFIDIALTIIPVNHQFDNVTFLYFFITEEVLPTATL